MGLGPVELLISFILYLAGPGMAVFLAWRMVRAHERRAVSAGEVHALNERIARLEEQVSGLGTALEEIAEGQRFTTRVLAERIPAHE